MLLFKTGQKVEEAFFGLKIGIFDHVHKNLSGPKSRKAKNHFYCGSLCQRLVLSFRKRNFLIRQLFLVKTDRQRLKTSRPKKTIFPHFPPIFDEIPNKYG